MTIRFALIIPFCLMSIAMSYCQVVRRTIITGGTRYELSYKSEETTKSSKLSAEKKYYCIQAELISTSQGGCGGYPLHGKFQAYDLKDQLREQGEFFEGLKNGEWRTWTAEGILISIETWRMGKKHGHQYSYNPQGRLSSSRKYKHGQLHGKTMYYESDTTKVEKYKHGELVIPQLKEKKSKSEDSPKRLIFRKKQEPAENTESQ